MNKTLLKRIASVATELDYAGFTKEAKYMDSVLLKLSHAEMENLGMGDLEAEPGRNLGMGDFKAEPGKNMPTHDEKFKVYKSFDEDHYPHDYEILLISARSEEEAVRIIDDYKNWEAKYFSYPEEMPMASLTNKPGVIWSNPRTSIL